jgi:predicted TPR repeat methyltransferase
MSTEDKRTGRMDRSYWDEFADEYDEFVIDAFTYGRTHTVGQQIKKFASPRLTVADYGCGPGKLLPYLAPKFKKVYGFDFSEKLLDIARERTKDIPNVEIDQADLTQPVNQLPQVHVIVSLNAAIMPDTGARMQFLRGMTSRLKPRGILILNVPSVESLLFAAFRETEWYRRLGHSPRKAESQTDITSLTGPRMAAQGVYFRGSEPTKHYLREELEVLVRDEMQLELLEIIKMEYDWTTEFEVEEVPDWMADPYPWDWMVTARAPG